MVVLFGNEHFLVFILEVEVLFRDEHFLVFILEVETPFT